MASCILTCLTVMFCVFETTLSQNFVSLKTKVFGRKTLFECRIDRFAHTVEFIDPNELSVGSCVAPVPPEIDAKKPKDCGNNITQYFSNNSVILSVENPIPGVWTCKHGSGWSNDSVDITSPDVGKCIGEEDKRSDNCISTIAVCLILLPVVFVVSNLKPVRKRVDTILAKLKRRHIHDDQRSDTDESERQPLLRDLSSVMLCVKCHLSCNKMCIDCNDYYCTACLNVHQDTKDHNVFSLEQGLFPKGKFNVVCKVCKNKLSEEYCLSHKKLVCASCVCVSSSETTQCKRTQIILPTFDEGKVFSVPEDVKHVSSINLYADQDNLFNKRVCGIVSLPNNTLLIADTNSKKLLWFFKFKWKENFSLPCEPKSLIHLFDSRYAISFPQQRKVRVYDFKKDQPHIEEVHKVDFDDGKPYSLAYTNNRFAVEINQGDLGYIGIFEYDGKPITKMKLHDLVYFSGNQIRLAMENISLFVSAIGKKQIFCIDINTGGTKWNTEMPSPRSIIFFPTDSVVGKETLLVANKRSDVVYKVNPNNGNREVFLSDGKFSGPRYMAYDKFTKLLYIYGDNEMIQVYEYRKCIETV